MFQIISENHVTDIIDIVKLYYVIMYVNRLGKLFKYGNKN